MINKTGVINKWVLVYNKTNVIVKQRNENQETTSMYNIDVFDTEEEMESRIIELNIIDLPSIDEEEEGLGFELF